MSRARHASHTNRVPSCHCPKSCIVHPRELLLSPRSDSAGGLGGHEILKIHDADPFLGVEVKFNDMLACRQFLESYSSGAVRQSLSQHAGRLLTLPQEFTVETQLKASAHILDLCLDQLELCLQHVHLSQVSSTFLLSSPSAI